MARPKKPVVIDGKTIDGLYRYPNSNKWRINQTGTKFRADDPRIALLKFRQWEARQDKRVVRLDIPVEHNPTPQIPDYNHIHEKLEDLKQNGSAVWPIGVNENAFWARVREEILSRPQYVAEVTGIEQIGYLHNLRKPEPSPTLEQLGEMYYAKDIDANWLSKARTLWPEFCKIVGVEMVRELTQEMINNYKTVVVAARKKGGWSPTYVRHRFEMVKAVLRYPTTQGKWSDDCNRALGYCTVLVKPIQTPANPKAISVEHFSKLYRAADAQTKAILLVALNACMYGREVAALKWSEIDLDEGTLVARRNKTSVVRAAVLWPETVKALRALPKTSDDAVFITTTGMQHTYDTVYLAFDEARKAAGLESTDVQFSHIRDGCYTAACEAEDVPERQAEMLAGHLTGIKDRYVMRRPKIVRRACEAVREAYEIEELHTREK